VIAGAVEKSYPFATHQARRTAVISMPAGQAHRDRFGRQGARLVVVEAENGGEGEQTDVFTDWGSAVIAQRMLHELDLADAFSDLALEGLALELSARVARRSALRETSAAWLDQAAEILRAEFRRPPSASCLASELGVSQTRLARGFRVRFGESLGSYARNARLDWAADRLLGSDIGLARVACEAGFADQSHLTRAFSARFGVPPGRFRATRR
jgi:AraC family transcriptional regulator